MLVNPFETSVDLRNLIFEKTQELVRTVSALNGSRLELLDFAEQMGYDRRFDADQ